MGKFTFYKKTPSSIQLIYVVYLNSLSVNRANQSISQKQSNHMIGQKLDESEHSLGTIQPYNWLEIGRIRAQSGNNTTILLARNWVNQSIVREQYNHIIGQKLGESEHSAVTIQPYDWLEIGRIREQCGNNPTMIG